MKPLRSRPPALAARALAATAAAALLVLWLAGHDRDAPARSPAMPSARAELAVPGPQSTAAAPALTEPASLTLDPPPLPPEEPAPPGAPSSIDLGRWERRFAEARPALLKFKTLKSKVVRTAAENDELKRLLTDEAMVKTAARDLVAGGERALEDSRELLRIYQIDYLAMALGYDANPNRAAVLDAVVSVLRAENLPARAPLELRQSLAGDKLELMEALVALAPDAAKEVVRRAEGTPLEPLLAEAETRGYGMIRFRERTAAQAQARVAGAD